MKRIYNLKREQEDKRDILLSAVEPDTAELPRNIDLRTACPAIFNQGELNSCTANVGVAAYMMLHNIDTELSRLYLYYKERSFEGTIDYDAGATMRSIGKALHKSGICTENLWPYVVENYDEKPSDHADTNASTHKITAYKKIFNYLGIKQYIAKNNLPVMIGMEVYQSFEYESVSNTGIVPLPGENETLLGGHAVLVVGYDDDFRKTTNGSDQSEKVDSITNNPNHNEDDTSGYFIVRNSWGKEWGDDGYFYLPYSFVSKYAFDFWVIE